MGSAGLVHNNLLMTLRACHEFESHSSTEFLGVFYVLCANTEICIWSKQSNYIRSYTGFGWFSAQTRIIQPCRLLLLISSQSVWRLEDAQATHLPTCWSHRRLTSRNGSVCESSSLGKLSLPAFVWVGLRKERIQCVFLIVTSTKKKTALGHPEVKVSKFTFFIRIIIVLFYILHCATGF